MAGGGATKWAATREDFAKYQGGANYLASYNYGPVMTELERGSARALVYTAVAAPGSYIEYGPFSQVTEWSDAIEEVWAKALDLTFVSYLSVAPREGVIDTMRAFMKAPIDKHKGYPDHSSGRLPNSLQAHASLALALEEGQVSPGHLWNLFSEQVGYDPCYTQFIRIQTSAKWITAYKFGTDGWAEPSDDYRHYYPRTRSVFAPGMWWNLALRKVSGFLKGLTRGTRWHALEPAAIRAQVRRVWSVVRDRRGWVIDSVDQSGFDRHQHNRLQRLVLTKASHYARRAGYITERDERVWNELIDLSIAAKVLCPPYSSDNSMFLREKEDTLGSGLSYTSGYGNMVLGAYVRILVASWLANSADPARVKARLDQAEFFIATGQVEYQISGDDIVITRPKDRPSSTWPSYGLKSESVPGAYVWLSKERLEDGSTRSILGNHFAKKVAPERSDIKRPRALDLIAMAATLESAATSVHPGLLAEVFESFDYGRDLVRAVRPLTAEDLKALAIEAAATSSLDERERVLQSMSTDGNSDSVLGLAQQALSDQLAESGSKRTARQLVQDYGPRLDVNQAIEQLMIIRG